MAAKVFPSGLHHNTLPIDALFNVKRGKKGRSLAGPALISIPSEPGQICILYKVSRRPSVLYVRFLPCLNNYPSNGPAGPTPPKCGAKSSIETRSIYSLIQPVEWHLTSECLFVWKSILISTVHYQHTFSMLIPNTMFSPVTNCEGNERKTVPSKSSPLVLQLQNVQTQRLKSQGAIYLTNATIWFLHTYCVPAVKSFINLMPYTESCNQSLIKTPILGADGRAIASTTVSLCLGIHLWPPPSENAER